MVENEDWLMRPVSRHLCRYSELHDCSLDLGDIYRMNEMLDVETENAWRAQKAAEAKQQAPRR